MTIQAYFFRLILVGGLLVCAGPGFINAQEYIAGDDRGNPASTRRGSGLAISGTDIVIGFPTVAGRTCRPQRSDTLETGPGTTLQEKIAGRAGDLRGTDAGTAPQSRRFYRLVTP